MPRQTKGPSKQIRNPRVFFPGALYLAQLARMAAEEDVEAGSNNQDIFFGGIVINLNQIWTPSLIAADGECGWLGCLTLNCHWGCGLGVWAAWQALGSVFFKRETSFFFRTQDLKCPEALLCLKFYGKNAAKCKSNFGFNPPRWGSFGWWLQVFLGAVCWGPRGGHRVTRKKNFQQGGKKVDMTERSLLRHGIVDWKKAIQRCVLSWRIG